MKYKVKTICVYETQVEETYLIDADSVEEAKFTYEFGELIYSEDINNIYIKSEVIDVKECPNKN